MCNCRGDERLRYGLEAYLKHLKGKWIDYDQVPAAKNKLDSLVSGGKLSFQLVEQVNEMKAFIAYLNPVMITISFAW